jgi:hypothetical protein
MEHFPLARVAEHNGYPKEVLLHQYHHFRGLERLWEIKGWRPRTWAGADPDMMVLLATYEEQR